MYVTILVLLTFFFLIGSFFLSAFNNAFRKTFKRDSKKQLSTLGGLFFYRPLHVYFFPHHEVEGIFFAVICAQNIARIGYVICATLLFAHFKLVPISTHEIITVPLSWSIEIGGVIVFIIFSFLVCELLPRIFGNEYREVALKMCAPVGSLFMLLAFPFTYLFLKLSKQVSHSIYFDFLQEPKARVKQEIIEIIQQADTGTSLETGDKKLIESVVMFRHRIAREVMVPRVNVFSLSAEISIKEAARLLENEGYSRTPVYRNSVDNVIGVLMYKDILRKYMEFEQKGNDPKILSAPIEMIVKNVLYTPETKKISDLLQEFRKKQVHLAIVVDEYGGTEGIVTIEDILEEIVGEIADEYDEDAKACLLQPDGSWIVDTRMSILDIEEQTGLTMPQEGDYDTIGGYIYHRAGTIPPKGFVIFHDDFKLEVIKSSERSIEKLRITPLKSRTADGEKDVNE